MVLGKLAAGRLRCTNQDLPATEGGVQRKQRRLGAGSRGVAAAGLTLVLALSVAACGSSSTSSSDSSAGGQANTAAAQAAIAPYTGHTSAFPVTEPLSKKLPAGTKFAYLQCGAQACAVAGKTFADAVKAIGGELTVVNAGSTASTAQAAVSSVLALKPAVTLATGLEPSLYGGGLKTLSDAGIKVVSISVAQDITPFGITFNYLGQPTFELAGRLLANWVIANKGAKANVVFYGVPEISFSPIMQKAFEQEMQKNCPTCTERTASVGIATLGTTASRTVVTDLQSHPDTSTAVFATAGITSGLAAAMKAANLSATTLGYAPQAGNLQDIKDGKVTAGLAVDYSVSVWAAVDAAARLVLGDSPTPAEVAGEVPFQFLGQKDITFDPTNGWTGYPDYAQRFAKLWHTAA